MDAEMREYLKGMEGRLGTKLDEIQKEINEGFEEVKDMMDHGFSQLLPKDQWPPNAHDLQQAEIRRKI